MNIAFFNISKVQPWIEGIERVTDNLTHYFRERGIGYARND